MTMEMVRGLLGWRFSDAIRALARAISSGVKNLELGLSGVPGSKRNPIASMGIVQEKQMMYNHLHPSIPCVPFNE